MIPSDQAPPNVDWLVRRVTDLERQVRELQAGRRLEAATIGSGGITVKGGTLRALYPDGGEAFLAGLHHLASGTPVRGIVVRRPGNVLSFWSFAREDGTGNSFWALFDRAGNIVVSDDAESGEGLARPWLPYVGRPSSDYVTPLSTTSGTFTPLWTYAGVRQHPRTTARLLVQTDAGTTAEVQLRDTNNNTVVAGPEAVGASANTYVDLTGALTGPFSGFIKVDVEARRVSGTGSVRVVLVYAVGRQS